MPELGEQGIDLSFEDLQFIDEEISDDLSDTGTEKGAGEAPAKSGEGEGEDPNAKGPEKGEEETPQKTKDNDESAEGDDPDAVSGDSTEDVDGEGGEQSSPKLYHTLASTLVEQGVLSSVEESSLKDIKNIDDFVEVMKSQIKAQELSDLTDVQKDILTGMRDGVADNTVTKFKDAMGKLEGISNDQITDNANIRKDLIYQSFLAKGFTKERAELQVDRSVKLGVDLEDAIEAHKELSTVVKSRYQAEIDKEKESIKKDSLQIEKDKVALEKTMLKREEVITGYKIPESTRKEVYKEMMENVSINPETKEPENSLMKYQRENPEEFTHKLYYLWKMSEGFENLNYFKGKKASSTVKDLENAIRNSTHIQGGGDPSYADDINTGLLDIEDIVVPE